MNFKLTQENFIKQTLVGSESYIRNSTINLYNNYDFRRAFDDESLFNATTNFLSEKLNIINKVNEFNQIIVVGPIDRFIKTALKEKDITITNFADNYVFSGDEKVLEKKIINSVNVNSKILLFIDFFTTGNTFKILKKKLDELNIDISSYMSLATDERFVDVEFDNDLKDINFELKYQLSKMPNLVYDLTSRKFEELICDIFKDMGYLTEITRVTRDGGKDIIAYMEKGDCKEITFIECKKYHQDYKVGVKVIRELYGVQSLEQVDYSIVVTTSSFTSDAKNFASMTEGKMKLYDFTELSKWFKNYQYPKFFNKPIRSIHLKDEIFNFYSLFHLPFVKMNDCFKNDKMSVQKLF